MALSVTALLQLSLMAPVLVAWERVWDTRLYLYCNVRTDCCMPCETILKTSKGLVKGVLGPRAKLITLDWNWIRRRIFVSLNTMYFGLCCQIVALLSATASTTVSNLYQCDCWQIKLGFHVASKLMQKMQTFWHWRDTMSQTMQHNHISLSSDLGLYHFLLSGFLSI